MTSSYNTFTTENIVLLGNSGVGKTYFLQRCLNKVHSNFHPAYAVGVQLRSADMIYHGIKISYKLWDTPGQPKYDELSKIYMKSKRCFIIFYDVGSKQELVRVPRFLQLIEENAESENYVLLMGNKVDKLDETNMGISEILRDRYSNKNNYTFAEVSCKYQIEKAVKVFMVFVGFLKECYLLTRSFNQKWIKQLGKVFASADYIPLNGWDSDKVLMAFENRLSKRKNIEEAVLINWLFILFLQLQEHYQQNRGKQKKEGIKINYLEKELKNTKQVLINKQQEYQEEIEQMNYKHQKRIENIDCELLKLQFYIVEMNKLHQQLNFTGQTTKQQHTINQFHEFSESIDQTEYLQTQLWTGTQFGSSFVSRQSHTIIMEDIDLMKVVRKKKRQGLLERLQKYEEIIEDLMPNSDIVI